MERKFKHYIIKTSFENDMFKLSEEIINYKDALKLYNKLKEEQNNNDYLIEFFGVLPNGEYQILFSKSYVKSEKESETLYDLLKQVNDIMIKIEARTESINGLAGFHDKKRDVIYHEIENKTDITDAEKIHIFDKLHKLAIERRDLKEEINLANVLNGGCFCSNFKKLYNSIKKAIDKNTKVKEKIAEGNIPKTMMIQEIPYKSHKERIGIFSNMQKKYDKVTYDEERKVVIGYNKCVGMN